MILRSAQHVRLMTKTSSRSRSRSHSDRAPPPPSSSGSTRPLLPTYSGDSTARSPIVMTTSLWVEEADLPMQPLSWGRATGPPLVHLCRRAKESPKDNTITFFFPLEQMRIYSRGLLIQSCEKDCSAWTKWMSVWWNLMLHRVGRKPPQKQSEMQMIANYLIYSASRLEINFTILLCKA